ncbi:MAG: hypothetical protein ACJAZN_000968 [Planctomycetota bacterium]|jgi:hypothetical protein
MINPAAYESVAGWRICWNSGTLRHNDAFFLPPSYPQWATGEAAIPDWVTYT